MKPAIWNWINMLRTTQLPKGRGSFESEGCYCALGILCLANGQSTKVGDIGNWNYAYEVLQGTGVSPWKIGEWNDNENLSFPEIAERLEAHIGALS